MVVGNASKHETSLESGSVPMGEPDQSDIKQSNKQYEHSSECESCYRDEYHKSLIGESNARLDNYGYKRRDHDLPITAIQCDDPDFDL